MKKLFLSALLLAAASTVTFAQQTDDLAKEVRDKSAPLKQNGNNELKINLLTSVLGNPEVTYERLLEDNMGIGASLMVGFTNNELDMKFSFIPHYRIYFGAKKASGFFIEGNAAVVTSSEEGTYLYANGTTTYAGTKDYTNFGLGAAVGGKFLTRNGFLGELYTGVGRLFGSNGPDAYPRIGITLGKRF